MTGTRLRTVFDDLVRFETELWNAIDLRLQQECGISLGTLNVLLVVQDTPECRVNEVAASLAITVGGASQAVDRIEARGLLERRPHPSNRRSSLLELTPHGRNAAERAGVVFDAELERWLAPPGTENDVRALGATLALLRDAAQRRRDDPHASK